MDSESRRTEDRAGGGLPAANDRTLGGIPAANNRTCGEILAAKGLDAGYDGKVILSGVSFTVRPGEILTLVGPNGAGKSTVLKTIAKLLEPAGGTIYLKGTPMEQVGGPELSRTLSILMTERIRGEMMTCTEVVESGRYPYTGRFGALTEADRDKVREAMDLVHVSDLGGQLFSRVSDGQRQRVMLARAICQEPEILVMDEPTSFLDIRYKLELMQILKHLAKEKRVAMILSLHELELAARISDRLLCVRDGKADRIGTPEEVLTESYVEALYDLPEGSCRTYFAPLFPVKKGEGATNVKGDTAGEGTGRGTGKSPGYAFFQNRACESFPCHKGVPEEDFNCLFCYCPLYTLGPKCGGGFTYTSSGVKSCMDCSFPHRRENYAAVTARYPELKALALAAKENTERKQRD